MYDVTTGQELTDSELDDLFSDYLDETNETVEIAGIEFSPSKILQECDPIAFNCYRSDWESMKLDDGDFTEEAPDEDEDED